ncbi:glycine-rich domain-containing protein [Polaromonas glacialis]|uniref:glycine-rich domain-containing protein n=1 Tax=Polaromonas glacialis TaxID=866564 RepID=UPI0006896464|nr:hypothetical protein [Polaromonas glacialis]
MTLDSKTRSVQSLREGDYLMNRPDLPMDQACLKRLLRDGVDPRVAAINLEAVKATLRAERCWSVKRADLAEREYKRLLTLRLWNSCLPYPLVPTKFADAVWHAHILDTHSYHKDMQALFGEYLHHFPYLGFGSELRLQRKYEAFERTCALYERTFGEPMTIVPAKSRRSRLAIRSTQ